MNNDTISNENWSSYIQSRPINGRFEVYDKLDSLVEIEWQKTSYLSAEFTTAMKQVCELGIDAFTQVEMQFLHSFPEVVGTEPHFKPFESLFSKDLGFVDWEAVKTIMQSMLRNLFVFDTSKLSEEIKQKFANDTIIFATVKSASSKSLQGFIVFLIKPEFTPGTIKVINLAVASEFQNRGLAKLLMSSIFNILPKTTRIFLCTRITNIAATRAYKSWGFIHDQNPIQDSSHTFNLQHWIFMEYKAQQSNTLQKVAESLKISK